MRISIIIPTLNESAIIASQVEDIRHKASGSEVEIIVVDAKSPDGTAELAKAAGAKVLSVEKGCRAKQMNAGAAAATGEVYYFVHADLTLPHGFADDIIAGVNSGNSYGCYQVCFDKPVKGLQFNSSLSKYQGIFFRGGDQTLYMTKLFFEKIGGFDDEVVIMEDYEILLRAKKHEKINIMPKKVVISARKMEENNYFKTNVINVLVFTLFFLGASQKTLVNIYQGFVKGAKYSIK
ncbi:TIGR04283 family arsenosugar biosynthesis glycosyltransferase [Roseivirga pacifica]|uniref:TIGR04283 family arsenosugar biosynthesis glycosyltransferase n=1 Tax=Roseivirga pacifica TaxID=1267423 RepID=UPI00227CE65B|nr:TIGR04283 family arsenosugar biosynthesis glycosyltransferase [Roseivirga pacifica]